MTNAWIPIWIMGGPLLGTLVLSVIYSGITLARQVWIPIPNAR